MALFAGFGIGIIFVFVFGVIISGLLMWLAAKISKVEKATFTRAATAAVACSFVTVLFAGLFGFVPVLGNFFGFVVGLLVSIYVIKVSFATTFGKALLVWIFDILGSIVAIALASMLMATAVFLH
jgi:hypothetical protein